MKYLFLSILFGMSLLNCKSQDGTQTAGNASEKSQVQLLETKWMLATLNGKPIEMSNTELSEPFLRLTNQDNGAGGNGGCNVFGGSHTLKEKNQIEFSQMMATMRYCEDNGVEKGLMGALQKAKSYSLEGDDLALMDENGSVLASFKAASEKEQ